MADHPGARERGDEGDLTVCGPAGGVFPAGDVGGEAEEEVFGHVCVAPCGGTEGEHGIRWGV